MRVVFYTNNVSPHQLPLAEEVASRVGREDFLYVGDELEWRGKLVETSVRTLRADDPEAKEWLENAEVMYTGGLRPVGLMERRARRGLKTLYYSERWFKPVRLLDLRLLDCLIEVTVPGWVRMFVPWYRKMARRFVRLANANECVRFLPVGPWARRDFLRMGVRAGKTIPWGYFVSPGAGERRGRRKEGEPLKVLWAGRDVRLKRVEDIERAVALANGDSGKSAPVAFTKLTGIAPAEVRRAMREHDVFVLASNGHEGWGAVVNEALEEGMDVIGTYEAGASAAMLPQERLYHAGDARALAALIGKEMRGELPSCSIGEWTARRAAERLLES